MPDSINTAMNRDQGAVGKSSLDFVLGGAGVEKFSAGDDAM
jgi:hypothetical protein